MHTYYIIKEYNKQKKKIKHKKTFICCTVSSLDYTVNTFQINRYNFSLKKQHSLYVVSIFVIEIER